MKARSLIVLFLLAFAAGVRASPAQRLTIDVNLTMLTARVTDEGGNAVLDLTGDDFELLDNGRPTPIEHFSLDSGPPGIGLLVDTSLSLRRMKSESEQMIGQLITPMTDNDEVFLMTFASNSELVVKPTNRRAEITRAIGRVKSTAGTRFYDAVIDGLDVLSQIRQERKALIILTDGADHYSAHTFPELLRTARLYGCEIYIIGYSGDDSRILSEAGRSEIRSEFFRLAGETGGQVFFPANPQESFRVARQIVDSLHHEYRFGFYSSHPFNEPSEVSIRIRGSRGEHLSVHTSLVPPPLP
jgi:VWFA-related protein